MSLPLQTDVSLKKYTTLQVGGVASRFVEVGTEKDLEGAVQYAKDNDLPITVFAGGTNVLVSDSGVQGLVLRMVMRGITTEIQSTDVLLTASAGEVLDDVVAYAVEHRYWGLENLSHIPGTVGATPVQNVGAYGVEVKDLIQTVRVYNTEEQKFEILTNEDCSFTYRDSVFKTPEGKKYIVVSVTYVLSTQENPRLEYKDLQNQFQEAPSAQAVREAVIAIRSKKFPDWKVVGTAGSFFKNPIVPRAKFEELSVQYPGLPGFDVEDGFVKLPLGWILDKVLHLKGEGTEHVGTYQGQALVLINKGAATATDIVSFAEDIMQKVYSETGIEIQWEVTKIGF